jgi:alpha-amylase/alpha-mannosidase (GH57 family)
VPKFLCVHGHFYQPPRENAWLERIDRQESAHPFHDWNARIESECYGPNARARILNGQDRVTAVVNNFANISFNIGPTLLSWLERHTPRTYAGVIAADRESKELFGRGSAMAQVYSHAIMPLASARDRATQVRWGVRDFEHRFGRKPEGMWLAETAACTASLRALADEGVLFTVLSPRQAKSVRLAGKDAHVPVTEATLDTRRPYEVSVGDGKSIAVFFYDGAASQAVAFERLLASGDAFAQKLVSSFSAASTTNELVHIATDGESYGHHHRFGEMALAYALRKVQASGTVALTNYASFLAQNPPKDEATIVERSSWSCAHGVGRWSADCGCRMRGDSNQAWRGPLRAALDFVAEGLDPVFEREGAALMADPWAARDRYIDVVLDRSPGSVDAFMRAVGAPDGAAERRRVLSLMEMQRNRVLMYTSCGWFFDDVSGIETAQILQYAVRAVELSRALGGPDLEPEFMVRLEAARATTAGTPSAREVVEKQVLPARADAQKVAATVAVASLFRLGAVDVPAFTVEEREIRTTKREHARLATGSLAITSNLTGEQESYSFSVLHEGGPHVKGGLRRERDVGATRGESERWLGAFDEDPPESLRNRIEQAFPIPIGPLRGLLLDERLMVVERILADAVRSAELAYRRVMGESASLLSELAATGVRPPRALTAATRVVLEADLLRAPRRSRHPWAAQPPCGGSRGERRLRRARPRLRAHPRHRSHVRGARTRPRERRRAGPTQRARHRRAATRVRRRHVARPRPGLGCDDGRRQRARPGRARARSHRRVA